MENKTKLKAIIFDFDGVILESSNIKTEAFIELFKDFPMNKKEILDYHLLHQGESRFVKFEYIYNNILKKHLSQHEKNELGKKFSNLVLEKILSCPFVPGAREFLSSYYKSIPFFVASGTPEEELISIIHNRGLNTFFKEVYGSPKLKPDIINNILSKNNFDRNEVLFVGDAISDYEAAKKCHVKFLARNTKEMEDFWITNSIKSIEDLNLILSYYEI